MTTDSEPMTWTGLPAELHLSNIPLAPNSLAEALRATYPATTVTVNGPVVVMERPSGDTDTWIGHPVDEEAERVRKLERFAELAGPLATRPETVGAWRHWSPEQDAQLDEMCELAESLGVAAK